MFEQVSALLPCSTAGHAVELGVRTAPQVREHRTGPNRYEGAAAMSISDHSPVGPSHTPLTGDERTMLATDAELSRVMAQALEDRDLETLTEAMAEKLSIERALDASRWETFNHRMSAEFGGGR